MLATGLYACTPDRIFDTGTVIPPPKDSLAYKNLKINEILASGNGADPDWVEIYNPTDEVVTLDTGRWFITDGLSTPTKYKIPYKMTLLPGTFWVIYCDGLPSTPTETHASFSLSKSGEDVGLFYQDNAGTVSPIDTVTFGLQTTGISYGRLPNGGANWQFFNNPTRGTFNQ